ncbi:VanZ family protein [Microbulbifer hainanensis]|uniref:VanZ family protein n=1 Tax=Microbulbifer hainanensis TaxID=2735675 RepID=UPI001867C5C9|nr:VanZ family protein [Microbulbifer hainanensis]
MKRWFGSGSQWFSVTALRAVFFALLMLCVYVGLRERPVPEIFRHFDWVLHWGAFFCLALLSFLVFPPRTWILAIPLLLIAGGGIELLQGAFLPDRTASWSDFSADTLGVFFGVAAGALLRVYRR